MTYIQDLINSLVNTSVIVIRLTKNIVNPISDQVKQERKKSVHNKHIMNTLQVQTKINAHNSGWIYEHLWCG